MNKETNEFIRLHNQLCDYLRELSGCAKNDSFKVIMDAAYNKSSIVRNYEKLMYSLNSLRNVLVHNEGNKIIAYPSDEALESLSIIVSKCISPKKLYDISMSYCQEVGHKM